MIKNLYWKYSLDWNQYRFDEGNMNRYNYKYTLY